MSVVILDPSYSKYMATLGKALATSMGGTCEAILSAHAYKIYCPGLKTHVYKTPDKPWLPSHCQKLTSSDIVWGKDTIESYKARYFTWLSRLFDHCQPQLCILHNEKFLLCTLAIELCEKKNIPYVVLERGAYRPFTTTCDRQGTNAASLFRQREHDSSLKLCDIKKSYRIGFERRAEKFIYARFLLFLIVITFENVARPGKRFLQHKKFSILSYASIALGFAKRKLPLLGQKRQKFSGKNLKKYVLVPLQRPGDTQLTFVEDYPGMQSFIDLVVQGVNQAAPDVELLFKSHPYDTSSYDFHGYLNERKTSISDLLENALLVITYNSTAGFEALCMDVPVICLGESFYTKEAYVYKADSLHANNIATAIQKALNEGSKENGDDIMANVLHYYQMPGSMYKYDEKDIASGASHIVEDLYQRV